MNCVNHEPVVRAVHELVSLTIICNIERSVCVVLIKYLEH